MLDAVVVGAGPAGAAAALELARAGRSVVLLERGPFLDGVEATDVLFGFLRRHGYLLPNEAPPA